MAEREQLAEARAAYQVEALPPPDVGLEAPLPPDVITFEEFLDRCDEDTWAEWVDGEVIVLSPASMRHHMNMPGYGSIG
jgi:hypothetical protein